MARGHKRFSSDVLATTRSTKGPSSLKCRPLLTYLPAHGPSECFQAPQRFSSWPVRLSPALGALPPHSAMATLLPHPQCLSAGCRGRPPVPHEQRHNSVEELTLLKTGHAEIRVIPSLMKIQQSSLGRGAWTQIILAQSACSPTINKGFFVLGMQ